MGQSTGRDKQRLDAVEWYGILLCSYATLVTPTGTEITAQVVFRNIARRRDIGELSALMTHGLLNVERNGTHGKHLHTRPRLDGAMKFNYDTSLPPRKSRLPR